MNAKNGDLGAGADTEQVKEHLRAHKMDVRSWEVAARAIAPSGPFPNRRGRRSIP